MAAAKLQKSREDKWRAVDGGGGLESILLALFGRQENASNSNSVSSESFGHISSALSANSSAEQMGESSNSDGRPSAEEHEAVSAGSLDTEVMSMQSQAMSLDSQDVENRGQSKFVRDASSYMDTGVSFMTEGAYFMAEKLDKLVEFIGHQCEARAQHRDQTKQFPASVDDVLDKESYQSSALSEEAPSEVSYKQPKFSDKESAPSERSYKQPKFSDKESINDYTVSNRDPSYVAEGQSDHDPSVQSSEPEPKQSVAVSGAFSSRSSESSYDRL